MKEETKKIILFFVIVGLVFLGVYRYVSYQRAKSYYDQRLQFCMALTQEINANPNKTYDECYCYYAPFTAPAGAKPLCACDCKVNGTIVTIGVTQAS